MTPAQKKFALQQLIFSLSKEAELPAVLKGFLQQGLKRVDDTKVDAFLAFVARGCDWLGLNVRRILDGTYTGPTPFEEQPAPAPAEATEAAAQLEA